MKRPKNYGEIAKLARELGISRQRAWAKIQVAKGKCMLCGKKRKNYEVYCDACAEKRNAKRKGDDHGTRTAQGK